MILHRSIIAACLTILAAFGCNQSTQRSSGASEGKRTSDYDLAIQSGIRGQSCLGQFNRLFPGSVNIISYHDGVIGPTSWTSSIGLHGRYVFKMHVPIDIKNRTNAVPSGAPTFYLYEFAQITFESNGQTSIQIRDQKKFSNEIWAQIVAANGDFNSLGWSLKTNNAVDGFESAWRRF